MKQRHHFLRLEPTINEDSLKTLALKHNFVSGKWLIPVDWSQADEVWTKLVRAFLSGKFPDNLGIRFMKVHQQSL
jgi:hypothetical protein